MYEHFIKLQKLNKLKIFGQSDFNLLGDHYDRDTKSMTNLKINVEKIDGTIKMLKGATLCGEAEEIFARYFTFVNGASRLYAIFLTIQCTWNDGFHLIRQTKAQKERIRK